MTVESGATGTPIGAIVQAGFALADWANRGTGLTKQERAQLAAARDAGYTRTRLGNVSPDGQRVTERQVLQAGAEILAAGPIIGTSGTLGRVIMPPTGTAPPYQSPIGTPTQTPPIMPRGGTAPPYQSPINRSYDYVRDPPRQPPPRPTARPPGRIIDPNLPYERSAILRNIMRAASRALIIGSILYPTPTASDDTVPGPMPGDPRTPGPSRRPRVRPRPGQTPDNLPDAAPGTPVETVTFPDRERYQVPEPQPPAIPEPVIGPIDIPTPAEPVYETPKQWPDIRPYLPLLAPLLTAIPRGTTRTPTQTGGSSPPRVPTVPLTAFEPAELQSPPETDPCKRSQPDQDRKDRKRKKRKCVNKITNKRTFTRNGQKFRTITRKLEC